MIEKVVGRRISGVGIPHVMLQARESGGTRRTVSGTKGKALKLWWGLSSGSSYDEDAPALGDTSR